MFRQKLARELAEAAYAFVVTFSIGYGAIHAAYMERGYRAIGDEYCLILITYLAAWKSIHCLFEALEEINCEGGDDKETGSGGTVEVQDHG